MQPLSGGQKRVQFAKELIDQPDRPRAIVEMQDHVLADAFGAHIVRGQMQEAQLVWVAQIGIVDRVMARVATDEIDVRLHGARIKGLGIRRIAADDGLVAPGHIEEIDPGLRGQQAVCCLMRDDAPFIQPQHIGQREHIKIEGHILIGRQRHLQDEGLIDPILCIEEEFRVGRLVVGIDLLKDTRPFREIVKDRVVFVAGGRPGKNGLEHRHHFAVGGRPVGIRDQIIGDALREIRQPVLKRQTHGKPRGDQKELLRHHIDHFDHRADDRLVFGVGQAVAPALDHLVIDEARDTVQCGRQHFFAEFHPAKADRVMELSGGQHLHAVSAVKTGADFAERFKIDGKVAQVEFAGIAGLELQFQRTVEIARPDKEGAVLIGNLDRVIHADAIGEADADGLHLDPGIGVEIQPLDPPFLPRIAR